MSPPGFHNPQGQFGGEFESWVWQQLDKPLMGMIRGWHIVIALVVMAARYVYRMVTKPGKTVTASHILVSSEKECLELKQKIHSGSATFAELAEAYSTCPSGKKEGKLGTFGPGQMVPAFDKLCFSPSTPMNQAVGPVQTHHGFHLIFITERDLGKDTPKTD
mmetsp:Transcript_40497/g.114709  ORF Transcript_40497/g.114709 Transcript_40497/m.114709 type:complete len:162 (+) Transcript_40497:167-652(+)